MSDLNEIVGKVVVKVDHIDNFDGGIVITFSDGTSLAVTEYAQTGKLDVSYHNEVSTKPTVQEWMILAERKRAELAIAMIEEGCCIDKDGSLVRLEVSRDLYEEFHKENNDD
jgi:hypothetical protein